MFYYLNVHFQGQRVNIQAGGKYRYRCDDVECQSGLYRCDLTWCWWHEPNRTHFELTARVSRLRYRYHVAHRNAVCRKSAIHLADNKETPWLAHSDAENNRVGMSTAWSQTQTVHAGSDLSISKTSYSLETNVRRSLTKNLKFTFWRTRICKVINHCIIQPMHSLVKMYGF